MKFGPFGLYSCFVGVKHTAAVIVGCPEKIIQEAIRRITKMKGRDQLEAIALLVTSDYGSLHEGSGHGHGNWNHSDAVYSL